MSVSEATLDLVVLSSAAWLGTAVGAFVAVWTTAGYMRGHTIRLLERLLQREVAAGAAKETVMQKTVDRLRRQRNELLSACADARSALLETQLEARAREEQIRRQALNSGFGAL